MRFKSMISPLCIVGEDILSDEQKMEMLSELYNPRPHVVAATGIGFAAASAASAGDAPAAVTAVAVTVVCLLLRIVIWWRFRTKAQPDRFDQWLKTFALGSLCSAIGWSTAFFFLFQVQDMSTLLIAAGVSCAIVQGTAARGYAVPGTASWNIAIVLSGIASAALIEGNQIILFGCGVYFFFLASFIVKMVRLSMRQIRAEAKTSALLEEITEKNQLLEDANKRLADSALTDGLTGVANRRAFDSDLLSAFNEAMSGGPPVALLLIDVDHFKSFNDAYGHQAGDSCLQEIANCLRETVFETGATVARYGGEEFAVVLPGRDQPSAHLIAQKVRLAVQLRDLSHLAGTPSRQTVSIGIALSTQSGVCAVADLVKSADLALYKAKRAGRNMVVDAECGVKIGSAPFLENGRKIC